MRWCLSNRADPAARVLADRHYNRQKVGSPQFVSPGSCLVLLSDCGRAFWVTSYPKAEYVKHAWAGAWMCSAFRNEGAGKASELIREAVAATRSYYGDPPPLGMVTFVDRDEVRPFVTPKGRAIFGQTFRQAGFRDAGETEGGLLALQLLPVDMPPPCPARPRSVHGMPLFDSAPTPSSEGLCALPSDG